MANRQKLNLILGCALLSSLFLMPGVVSVDSQPRGFIEPVFHSETKLLWIKPDRETEVEIDKAADTCHSLEYGGLTYWRLPSADELRDLEEYDRQARQYKSPKSLSLGHDCYFSSTKDEEGVANLYFCFGGGGFRALKLPNLFLCVHEVG